MSTIQGDADALRTIKVERDKAQAHYEELNKEYRRREAEFIDKLRREGVDSIKYEGANFVPTETIYGQIQDREEFLAWAHENAPELVEERERKALLHSLAREHVDNGQPMPPGAGFYVKEYVSIRAA